MNCLQNLTSRVAGLDSNETTMRSIGLGTALLGGIGYSFNAIRTQFTNPNTTNDGNTGVINRFKNFINPQMKLSEEKDYAGNINPIRNVVKEEPITNNNKTQVIRNENTINKSGLASGAYKVAKGFVGIGSQMVEGDFGKNGKNTNTKSKFIGENFRNNKRIPKPVGGNNEEKK